MNRYRYISEPPASIFYCEACERALLACECKAIEMHGINVEMEMREMQRDMEDEWREFYNEGLR